MGRMYSALFGNNVISVATDMFEINAPSDKAVVVHGLFLAQLSELGEAQSEFLLVYIHRGTTSGSGGSSYTPVPMNAGDAAFGGTVETLNSTRGTVGSILHSDAWNVLAGYNLWWTPETRPVIPAGGRLTVSVQLAPADALTVAGTIYFEEI